MKKKQILIAGGSKGIGAATVRAFAKEGWDVTFIYHRSGPLAERLSAETGARAICCDLGEVNSIGDAISSAMQEAGIKAFDACIYNAGISEIGLFTDLKESEWSRIRSVNLDGCIHLLQAVIPGMVSQKHGTIQLISSMWGRCGASCEAAYSATKAGLIGLGKSLAKELGPSGIRVNAVCPGVIDTEMNQDLTEEDMRQLCDETPLGRIGKPEEVADLLVFLASEKASFITGQVVGIDGGYVI